ncbi:MAG: anthranilate synthase component I family protein [Bacteroidetes bacterium]|nr:anthranilate synthase component I family protein [Bacteroidota bacterium]
MSATPNILHLDWFVIQAPAGALAEEALLYPLIPADLASGKAFCLIPYKNPKNQKPDIKFFHAEKPVKLNLKNSDIKDSLPLILKAAVTKSEYIGKVNYLKKQISIGNIYEINYCIEFFALDIAIDPLSVYRILNRLTHAPYSRLVKLGNDYILSASPELFLKKEGTNLFTKPIKGTIRRGVTAKEDELLKQQLHTSIKERTENVMAVDVARNDLSRVASRGSVKVNRLYNIETYQTVHQMVSTVSCELKKDISFKEIIEATFPMASMTGAPKIKAMELIDETESFSRGPYSGAMGFIEENGDFELAVNIRSIFYNQSTGRLSIAVGSAITYLSDPEQEYEECLLKANALLKALNATIQEF